MQPQQLPDYKTISGLSLQYLEACFGFWDLTIKMSILLQLKDFSHWKDVSAAI